MSEGAKLFFGVYFQILIVLFAFVVVSLFNSFVLFEKPSPQVKDPVEIWSNVKKYVKDVFLKEPQIASELLALSEKEAEEYINYVYKEFSKHPAFQVIIELERKAYCLTPFAHGVVGKIPAKTRTLESLETEILWKDIKAGKVEFDGLETSQREAIIRIADAESKSSYNMPLYIFIVFLYFFTNWAILLALKNKNFGKERIYLSENKFFLRLGVFLSCILFFQFIIFISFVEKMLQSFFGISLRDLIGAIIITIIILSLIYVGYDDLKSKLKWRKKR